MPGQAHGGAYVSKGLQDKAALDYPRVWNDELPGVDDVLAEVEDIQVDDPRGVRWRIRGASSMALVSLRSWKGEPEKVISTTVLKKSGEPSGQFMGTEQ